MTWNTVLKDCPACGSKVVLQVYLTGLGEPVGNIYCIDKKCRHIYDVFTGEEEFNRIIATYGEKQ